MLETAMQAASEALFTLILFGSAVLVSAMAIEAVKQAYSDINN